MKTFQFENYGTCSIGDLQVGQTFIHEDEMWVNITDNWGVRGMRLTNGLKYKHFRSDDEVQYLEEVVSD